MTSAIKLGLVTLPLFLAESTTDSVKSSALGEWLVIGAAVLVIVQIGWGFIDRVKGGSAQKREVSFADELATTDDLRQAHGRIARERDEVEKKLADMKEELRQRREKIDQDLRAIAGKVDSETRMLSKKLDDEISALNERIDAIPGRVITLLRETKGLI